MTEDQQQRAVDHIARFLGRKPCPVCDLQVQWRLQNDVVVMLTVLDDGIDGDSGVQVIVATCPNCSYTVPFNAAHAGIVV